MYNETLRWDPHERPSKRPSNGDTAPKSHPGPSPANQRSQGPRPAPSCKRGTGRRRDAFGGCRKGSVNTTTDEILDETDLLMRSLNCRGDFEAKTVQDGEWLSGTPESGGTVKPISSTSSHSPCRWPLETRSPSSTVSLSCFSFSPSDLTSHPSPEDDARPPSPPPPAASAPPAQQPSASAKRGRGGPTARGGKYYPRGGSRQNTDREPPSEDPPAASDAKQRRRQSSSPFFI